MVVLRTLSAFLLRHGSIVGARALSPFLLRHGLRARFAIIFPGTLSAFLLRHGS